MPGKKIFVAVLIILVAIGGFVAGLYLLNERQNLQEEAAVPGGQAEVSILPATGQFDIGQTIDTVISFNSANIPVSGISVKLQYPFSGTTPELTVSRIDVNQTLTSSGDWTCPTQTSYQQGGNVVIDIGCANTSATGFVSNQNTTLATVKLLVTSSPTVQPLVISFDQSGSVITRKSDNQDILLIPTSTGSYTLGSAQVSNTPTTAVTAALTATRTPSTTATLTPTAAPAVTGELSSTVTPTVIQLPDTGVSLPTLFAVGLGVMVIVGSILLAI